MLKALSKPYLGCVMAIVELSTAMAPSSSTPKGALARLTPPHPRQTLHPYDRRDTRHRFEAPAMAGKHQLRRHSTISGGGGHGWGVRGSGKVGSHILPRGIIK